MASAAITVTQKWATIECDTTQATITKGSGPTVGMTGTIVNAGTVTAFLGTSGNATPQDVATTSAQAIGIIELPSRSQVAIPARARLITHKTASSSTTLLWLPD